MEQALWKVLEALLALLALPRIGLGAIFLVALLSATLLPLGSEPAVMALVRLDPGLFWPAVLVATLGNTLGGAITWSLGRGAERLYETRLHRGPAQARLLSWLRRFGPRACLLSWLPLLGDPLCALAGWLRLPFWPCIAYMAVGKFLRYACLTAWMLWLFPVQEVAA